MNVKLFYDSRVKKLETRAKFIC